jgi:sugar/nucleoside kinase (ribokinase family)
MSLKRKLLVIGGSYMNLQMKVSPLNKNGAITPGSEYRYHPFGDSAITAISAAKMGGECVFSTRFGDDMNGKRLYEYYKDCGISKLLMRKDVAAQTGMCMTVFSENGEHEHFLSEGASLRFTRGEIDEAFTLTPDLFLAPLEEIGYEERMVVVPADLPPKEVIDDLAAQALVPDLMIETSDFPVSHPAEEAAAQKSEDKPAEEDSDPEKIISSETVSSYIKQESLAHYALAQAEKQGVDILLQYTPFTAQYPLDTLQNIKMLVISDEMLYQLTGFFPNNTEKALRALVALSGQVKAKYYIVQQGDDSVFVYDGNRYEIISAPEALRKETREIGASMQETFMGALAAEYLETKNIVRACRLAIVVSMLTRSKFGNLEKMMSRAELEQFAAENGFELYK